jgi:hypothetical protein
MASAILQMLAIEVSGALRAPAALHLEGKRMDRRRETRKVLKKTIEEFGRKAFVAEDGAEVRHLAYAKDTPPKYATRPTPGALQPNKLTGVDARTTREITFSFEGIVTH